MNLKHFTACLEYNKSLIYIKQCMLYYIMLYILHLLFAFHFSVSFHPGPSFLFSPYDHHGLLHSLPKDCFTDLTGKYFYSSDIYEDLASSAFPGPIMYDN